MPGAPNASRRSRLTPSYATSAGPRLRTRRSRQGRLIVRVAAAVWESSWLVRQALVALALFLAVFGMLRAPLPALAGLQSSVQYYLTTDFDFRGATQYVTSANLKEKLVAGWSIFPELWDRLTGRDPSQPSPADASFLLPVTGTIASTYGYRPDSVTGEVSFHTGIDIMAAEGTPIVAALDGIVLSVEESATYGKVIQIDHGQGVITLYAHAKEITAKTGDPVKQGDPIGTVGKTGNATAPHCHFEIIISGQPADPLTMKGLAGL
jgi:murein DD-endopeptidase MepM/ murein hydrolase activator NlpD